MNKKVIVLKDVLSLEECVLFEKRFFDSLQKNEVKKEPNNKTFYHDTYDDRVNLNYPFFNLGYNKIEVFNLINRITSIVSNELSENLNYSHAFVSLCKNNSQLNIHNDTSNLDITLSINVGGLENWPIHISKLPIEEKFRFSLEAKKNPEIVIPHKTNKNFETFNTLKGSGVGFYARKFVHWRDKLICNEHEYVMQLCLHWTIVK